MAAQAKVRKDEERKKRASTSHYGYKETNYKRTSTSNGPKRPSSQQKYKSKRTQGSAGPSSKSYYTSST